MAITFTSNDVDSDIDGTTITSGTLTITAGDVVVAMVSYEDNANAGSLSISNSGTALTWTNIATTNTVDNSKVAAWFSVAGQTENRTVTITSTGSAGTSRALSCRVHTGADQNNPCPSGNRFSGVGGTDISQAITLSSSGSALWMIAADWNTTNSYAAITNCTLEATFNHAGGDTRTIIRPTVNPRTDATAFTIGETDTAGKICWIAFEVKAAVAMPIMNVRRLYANLMGL